MQSCEQAPPLCFWHPVLGNPQQMPFRIHVLWTSHSLYCAYTHELIGHRFCPEDTMWPILWRHPLNESRCRLCAPDTWDRCSFQPFAMQNPVTSIDISQSLYPSDTQGLGTGCILCHSNIGIWVCGLTMTTHLKTPGTTLQPLLWTHHGLEIGPSLCTSTWNKGENFVLYSLESRSWRYPVASGLQ
jgi:hypothetical protein